MALLHIEGFGGMGTDSPQMKTGVSRKYSANTTNLNRATGRFDADAVNLANNSTVVFPVNNLATVVVGFAYRPTGAPGSDQRMLRLMDGGTVQIELWLTTTGEIDVRLAGSTSLGVTSGLAIGTAWKYIELKATIDNTAGAIDLRVDGVSELSLSSVDTQNSANAFVTNVTLISGNVSPTCDYDDVYVLDTTGTANNDFLGNVKVTHIYPDADGDSSDFTPSTGTVHSDLVDENPADDDTTYVESVTTGHKDLWNYEAPGSLTGIKAVQINTDAAESDATDFTLKSLCKSGLTESADAAQALSSSYTTIRRVVENDPDTAAAWTTTGLGSAQFGVEVG